MFFNKRSQYQDILAVKDRIILVQQETIAIKNETIKAQKEHINRLQEELALKDVINQVERWNR